MLKVRLLSLLSPPVLLDPVLSNSSDALTYGLENENPAASFIAFAFWYAVAVPSALELSDECSRPPSSTRVAKNRPAASNAR